MRNGAAINDLRVKCKVFERPWTFFNYRIWVSRAMLSLGVMTEKRMGSLVRDLIVLLLKNSGNHNSQPGMSNTM